MIISKDTRKCDTFLLLIDAWSVFHQGQCLQDGGRKFKAWKRILFLFT